MSDVIQFPTKPVETVDDDNPIEVLKHLADAMASGDLVCDQMIITWAKQDGQSLSMGFKVAGEDSLTSAVGLLELTKNALME